MPCSINKDQRSVHIVVPLEVAITHIILESKQKHPKGIESPCSSLILTNPTILFKCECECAHEFVRCMLYVDMIAHKF